MPKFSYTARDANGAEVKGVEEALTVNLVHMALLQRELEPVEVKEKKSIWQLEITQRKVPRKELMHFSRQMAVFIKAGIPVLDALETISEEMGNKIFKQTLLEMAEALRAGDTFAGGFMGYLAATSNLSEASIRQAVVFGSVMASFTVEAFSLDRLRALDYKEIEARFREFKRLTHFEDLL